MQDGKATLTGVPREREALIAWLGEHGNDLTASAIACVPVNRRRAANLGRACRAPGSPACRDQGRHAFALFASAGEAAAAAQRLKSERTDWWIYPATIG